MARRKGRKEWNIITEKGWMSILGNTEVISDLMMQIFFFVISLTELYGQRQTNCTQITYRISCVECGGRLGR